MVERASLRGKKGTATVRFSARDDVAPIFRDVQDGIIRQVSVGYRVYKFEKTEGGADKIPVMRAIDWEPFEISLVPVGADADTGIRGDQKVERNAVEIVTRNQGNRTMNDVVDDLAVGPGAGAETLAERERYTGITTACRAAGMTDAFANDLIGRGIPIDQAREMILNELAERSQGQTVSGLHAEVGGVPVRGGRGYAHVIRDGQETTLNGLQNAFAHRLSLGLVPVEGPGEQFRGASDVDLTRSFLLERGERLGWMSPSKVVARAMSTSDFSILLEGAIGSSVAKQWPVMRSPLVVLAYPDKAADFRVQKRKRPGEFPQLLKVGELEEYRDGAFGEAEEKWQIEKWGTIVSISEETLVNDNLDAVGQSIRGALQAASMVEAKLLSAAITSNPTMVDTVPVFHADHGNLITDADFGAEGLSKARTAMRRQKGLDGITPLNIAPQFIVVPATRETAAEQIVSEIYPAEVEASNAPFRRLTIVADAMLDEVSEVDTYIFASPSLVPSLVLGYRDGNTSPEVRSEEGFRVDALKYKVRHDVGVGWIDYRGACKIEESES
ncbi:hypothetical protein FHS85_004924 [Rhodoligotrophos appendicifer]|nr:Mu-like prophage major head subunit gpT family protein [Rhodoligotrophos appendicifer]